jgi:hypothetical protein
VGPPVRTRRGESGIDCDGRNDDFRAPATVPGGIHRWFCLPIHPGQNSAVNSPRDGCQSKGYHH